MTEREPAPGGDEGQGGGPSQGDNAGQGGEPSGGADSDIYTPTPFGDYEIREGEYGPLDPTGDE
jgi:hypothetical protein